MDQVYDWDTYFENLYLSYYGDGTYCLNNFKAFLALQKPDGFIQRAFGEKGWGTAQPSKPFLAQIAVLGSKQNGNGYEWLQGTYYEGLKKVSRPLVRLRHRWQWPAGLGQRRCRRNGQPSAPGGKE